MRRAWFMGVALLVAAGCGGGGSQTASDVASATISDMVGGRSAGAWDRAHPEMQARISKADYVACATERAGTARSDAKVTVVEQLDAPYTTAAGASMPAKAVTVRVSIGRESLSTQVWLVDVDGAWRLVDVVSPGPADNEAPCMGRL